MSKTVIALIVGVLLGGAGSWLYTAGPGATSEPQAEPVARRLLSNKPDVMAALGQVSQRPPAELLTSAPPWAPCVRCGGRLFWADAREPPDSARWRCHRCDPPPPGLWRHACALPSGGVA